MRTSRQQVLEYVQAQRVATAGDLSRALHMTAANARHHLAILQQQGLVDQVGLHPARGKGRPAALFALSEQFLGDNLGALSSALLELIFQQAEESGGQDVVLRCVAARLAARMSCGDFNPDGTQPGEGASGKVAGSLTQRLFRAIKALERGNYQARWEAHIQGPRIILGHCPYAAILAHHPELCRLDVYLLEELLGERLQQVARLERDVRGVRYCLFRVVSRAPGGGR
ncbi:MAG: ArsR family transcriptional regulator [Anaerolineales bacterium]|nr:ArsR family transcriptional regulator [Anaerolineales bacterium]